VKSSNYYSPKRVYRVFILILSLFLLIKKRKNFLFFKPLKPKELRDTIIYLGASFIKLAQVLATRADFFTKEYLDKLKSLHDELPPMKQDEFEIVYKSAFGDKDIFKEFNPKPIASASIGQVHEAYLKDGTKVAVKLRRYNIKRRVKADINILNSLNYLFRPLFSQYTKNSIEAVIVEFAKMIQKEINLSTELENLKKFSKVYKDCGIIFPKPFEEYCSEDALVMSFEEGFRFDDKESLLKSGIDFKPIINKLVNFYAEQMLVKGFFHADPHPGNLLVNKKGQLILLDFGMVKRIDNSTRVAIIQMIKAAHEKDYETYVSSAKRLGTIAYEAPKAEVAELVERMFEIFDNNSLSAFTMQTLAFELLESTKDMPFKLPQEAIYILRASAIIEGLGTTYIPNFNGIKDILPILQQNIPRALGAKDSIIEFIIDEVKSTPDFLKNIKETMRQANDGELKVELSNYQLEWLKKEIKEYLKPIITSFMLILLAIFIAILDRSYQTISILIVIFATLKLIYLK